ncbi:DUF2779 domain-containing protein [Verrucomicrobiota bacterium]
MISKTDYLTWLSCLALLWYAKRDPEKLPQEEDPSADARMAEGKAVEALARRLHPIGTVIDHDRPFEEVIAASREAIGKAAPGTPACQALVRAGDLVCETDILLPVDGGRLDLFEVKATNEVKDEHLPDVAFQRHVLEQAGLSVRKAHVVHLDREYARDGGIDPGKLFVIEDVTAETGALVKEAASGIEEIQRVLASPVPPPIRLGEDDLDPRDYPLLFPDVAAAEHPVFDLYRGRQKAVEFYGQGIVATADIPKGSALTARQRVQVECEREGEPFLDRDAIRRFLSCLKAPLMFLDFETMAPAIPLVDGTSPYQQTPFQFSLHSCRSLEAEPEHRGWIWDPVTEGDPRLELLRRLEHSLEAEGSVIVYNAAFERMVLRQAAEAFPEFADFVEGVLDRVADLLVPFRSFAAHHPDQRGSCSIKAVLPAWCGKGYDSMAISGGEQAAREFVRVMFGDGAADRDAVRRSLEEYCALDTMAMLGLLRALTNAAAGSGPG